MKVITTRTHKQDDVFCSKVSMGVTPILCSLEEFSISQLFESPYFRNRTHIFRKNWGVRFLSICQEL